MDPLCNELLLPSIEVVFYSSNLKREPSFIAQTGGFYKVNLKKNHILLLHNAAVSCKRVLFQENAIISVNFPSSPF